MSDVIVEQAATGITSRPMITGCSLGILSRHSPPLFTWISLALLVMHNSILTSAAYTSLLATSFFLSPTLPKSNVLLISQKLSEYWGILNYTLY